MRTGMIKNVCLSMIASITIGCGGGAGLAEPVRTFQGSYNAAAPALGDLYSGLNQFRREAYMTTIRCDDSGEILAQDANGPTPLLTDTFTASAIDARVSAVHLIGRYADALLTLAGSDAPQRFATETGQLGTNLGGLSDHFRQLAGDPTAHDTSAANYVQPIAQLVGVFGEAYLQRRRDDATRTAVLSHADDVRHVLDLLEHDFTNVILLSREDDYSRMIRHCATYYNAHAAGWSLAERHAMQDEVLAILRQREVFRAADPAGLISAMRQAHEALVQFVHDQDAKTAS